MYEPYRIKTVEPLPYVSKAAREKILAAAGYNPFHIAADSVEIDLISDSGTGAMSSRQWSEVVGAREDFSGQQSYTDFVATARDILGFRYIQPVHQGRAAESLLFRLLLQPGDVALSNTFFETTRSNIEALGCEAVDLPDPGPPFCGNIHLERLEQALRRHARARLVVMTVTSNIMGGQPVALDNIVRARELAEARGATLVLDASRFAGNAFLVKELTRSRRSLRRLCCEIFAASHIAYLSCKKDGLANVGGLIGFNDGVLQENLAQQVIRQESFPSAGGLAARDLAAMTVGLKEAVDERIVGAHVASVRFLAAELKRHGARIFEPIGAHGLVIEPRGGTEHEAFALAAEIYRESGIRAGVFDGRVRLAVPRRVYTQNHLAHVGEVVGRVYQRDLMRLRCVHAPEEFFNFFARFEQVGRTASAGGARSATKRG